jgi:alpha-N-arabinofuranosidase
MPADNVEGFRADMVALLRDLDAGMYRWPGGNFVSGYDWRDGIGDRDKRRRVTTTPGARWSITTWAPDEFLTLCRLLKIDPFV